MKIIDIKEKTEAFANQEIHLNIPPQQKIPINPMSLKYQVDKIQDERIRDRMSKNPEYARIMSVNKSKLFFEWLMNKLQLKENIIIEIKGYTRSGKSTVAITIGKLISYLSGKEFTQEQVCKNESDYQQKIKNCSKLRKTFNTAWVVDEQILFV